MATSFEKPRDVVGGLVIVGIGGLFLLFGRELEMGTSFRMGAGYFATILSVLMIALGQAMVAPSPSRCSSSPSPSSSPSSSPTSAPNATKPFRSKRRGESRSSAR